MSKAGAAFSVRFLRNGDQVTVTRNIINRNGAGAALMQVVDPTSGVVAPNWDATGLSGDAQTAVLDAQPIIQIGVRSAVGYPAEITDCTWAYDGTTLKFTLNGSTWVTATNDSRFQARINGSYYELKIVGNLASKTVMANKQITYTVDYVCNSMKDSITESVDVLIQPAGSNSHHLYIKIDNVELDETHTSALLTIESYYGTSIVVIGSNGYTVKWYQDGVEISGQTGSTLTITRDMVEGGSLFIAKLFLNGNAVAQDSQRVSDVADEYQITHTPTSAGSNYCGLGHNATYTLGVLRNGTAISDSVTYSWQVWNALGEKKGEGTGATVTVTPDECLCGSGTGTYYADSDVTVTATF